MEPEMTACEPLSINGIQEVSGSIPLISTKNAEIIEISAFLLFFLCFI
jgi:hypothetical protein